MDTRPRKSNAQQASRVSRQRNQLRRNNKFTTTTTTTITTPATTTTQAPLPTADLNMLAQQIESFDSNLLSGDYIYYYDDYINNSV